MTDFTTKKDNTSRRKIFKTTVNQDLMDIGKMPPQAVDLEEAVLGAMMLELDVVSNTIDILKPECFYKDVNSRIYSAIIRLSNQNEPADILTVTQELKKTGELEIVGGAYYITQLTNRVASAANAEFHARIVLQKFMQRELIRIASVIIKESYEDNADVFDLQARAEKNLSQITEGNIKQDFESTAKLIRKTLERLQENGTHEDGLFGLPSGLTSLDRITGGWQKQNLIIIAARPGMGKSAFVLSSASNSAFIYDKKVGVFSLEMSKDELMERLISSEVEINNRKLRSGKLEQHEWDSVMKKCDVFYKENLFIDDTPGISVFELRTKARRLVQKKGIELLIVDYLQLMTASNDGYGNREQEISFISRSLKNLAKELNIPVIALSQLSRAVETRGGGNKPKLSDLRESGAIEQDADVVGFLWRPEYYDIKTDDDNVPFSPGESFMLIEKNRNGPLTNARFKFIGEYTKFVDWDDFDFAPQKSLAMAPNNDFTDNPDDDKPF